MEAIVYIILGGVIGSFLNVCIYRIPASREEFYEESPYAKEGQERMELSVTSPKRSICPKCKYEIPWRYNIPVIGWLMLRGKCANCNEKISVRYPAVEILTILFTLLTVDTFGLTLTGLVVYIFVCSLIVISFIDIDYYIIPNVISLPGTAIGFAIAIVNHFFHLFSSPVAPDIYQSIWGVVLGAGFLWLVAEFYLKVRKIEGLGMGDVKLLAMTGALFGPQAAFYTIFIGSVFGSILGVTMILFAGRKASQHIPFGPYLASATLLYIFSGNALIDMWVRFVVGDGGL